MVSIKSEREITLMRRAGKLAAECLAEMSKLVKPGVTPLELDKACREWTASKNAIPAPLNYRGFPASLCVSVNDVVCHGIPDNRPFRNGDIVNLDVTPILEGYHGDTNATIILGQVKAEVKRLVDVTYQAMWDGIGQVRPGNTVGDIGYAIQRRVEAAGFSVVVEYCGHGIGKQFHEEPTIPHLGRPGQGMKLREGMTFTIEPMVNIGEREITVDADHWTVRTADHSFSAQFEHTVLVVPGGVEVLTLQPGEQPPEKS